MKKWLEWLFPFLTLSCWSCKEQISRSTANTFYLKTAEGISEYKICGPCAKVLEAMKLQQEIHPRHEHEKDSQISRRSRGDL